MHQASDLNDPYGLSRPEMRNDPYSVYARLRREAPAYYSEGWKGWLLTRYVDVLAGFKDARLSANRSEGFGQALPPAVREQLLPLTRNFASWALMVDAPTHTRLRSLINRAFTPRMAELLRPNIQSLVDELLETARAAGNVDFVRDLATPLPVIVIGEMMGLPREDRHRLKEWSDAIATFMGARQRTPEVVKKVVHAIQEMEDYFRGLIAKRRQNPGEDLLSALLAAEEQGNILNEQELLSTCTMVLFGGHETTTNLIAGGLYTLLRHPEQWKALRESPELVSPAVEELLRFEAPVQRQGRVVAEDFELHGQTLRKGERVFLVMGSANRDAEQFPEPERLDVRRKENRHLTFGMGAHYCVGAALGRMEAQVTFTTLLRRFPDIALATPKELDWVDNLTIRGLESLPVELGTPRA